MLSLKKPKYHWKAGQTQTNFFHYGRSSDFVFSWLPLHALSKKLENSGKKKNPQCACFRYKARWFNHTWSMSCVWGKSLEAVSKNFCFSLMFVCTFYLLLCHIFYFHWSFMSVSCGILWVLSIVWCCVIAAAGPLSRLQEVALGCVIKWWIRLCLEERKMNKWCMKDFDARLAPLP